MYHDPRFTTNAYYPPMAEPGPTVADQALFRLQSARAQLAAARQEFDAAMNAYWDVTMGPAFSC